MAWRFVSHHFQVSVGDCLAVYPQSLGDVQVGHLPTTVFHWGTIILW